MTSPEAGSPASADPEEYLEAEWPPNPPIGQLPLEALNPLDKDGKPLEGKELTDHLYGLLKRRWALLKKDVFAEDSWIYTQEGKPRKRKYDEKWMLQFLILVLEGKRNTEIGTIMGIELIPEEDLETNGDKLGTSDTVVGSYKSRLLSSRVKEIGTYVRVTGKKLQLFSFTQKDPKTGLETETSKKIEQMRKALRLQHRIQLFNIGNATLPSQSGTGFYNFDTAIDVLYRSVIRKEEDQTIEQDVIRTQPKSYVDQGGGGRNVANLRLNLLSDIAFERNERRAGITYGQEMKPRIAEELLRGKSYAEVIEALAKEKGPPTSSSIRSYVRRHGNAVLAELSENDIRRLRPGKKELWSLAIAAFLFRYGNCTHGEAIDRATQIKAGAQSTNKE